MKIFEWIGENGALHMLCCLAIVTALAHIVNVGAAVFAALMAAFTKDIVIDKWLLKGVTEWHDIACDILGVVIGAAIVLAGGTV